MIIDINYTYTSLTSEEFSQLADLLNALGDRSLRANGDGTYTIEANTPYTPTPEEEIMLLKSYLSDTDYCVIKCLELGESPSALYPDIMEKRAEARKRINELEEVEQDNA